ncbi:response regulator [uncultured Desulfosarcina sp.]|uniref:response regulator n=1 Tax=uncultured Desulfosarcina sp. TaxID=218289 RepID=UPI0029C63C60|nr:response regulator [uncultured Desulfosarcina sp.]
MTGIRDILNAQQAAEFLCAHVETIRRMARKGTIPAFKIGKDWRFSKSTLMTWSEINPGIKKQVNILVIDDDADVCKLMSRLLEPQGYRVITATTGEEGLLHVQNDSVNLALLDLEMPVMSGPEFIRELRKNHKDIPVIVVTGYPDGKMMMEASRFGPLMLIPKPIDKKFLLSAVSLTLEGTLAETDVM